MKDAGIRRHPFVQRLEAGDEDVLFPKPPALIRMGTILVASVLLGLLLFVEFVQVHFSVPIALVAKESVGSSAVSGSSCAVPGVSGRPSLQAFGYLSQIDNVRVGQAVRIKGPMCAGGLCAGREGVIVSIATESRLQRGYLVRVRFQRALESDRVLKVAQHDGMKVSGRILTHDLFLREPFTTMGDWLFGEGTSLEIWGHLFHGFKKAIDVAR